MGAICKKIALLLVGLCCLCLAGCARLAPSIDELLRAPVLSGDYSAIQSALTERFGSAVQLKYPTEGELLSPFAFGDWDGDGVEDGLVLFTVEDSSIVLLAMLQLDQAGTWQVMSVANGLSDDVNTIELANMQEGDAQQIVVTFQAQGGQYLAVYTYKDGLLYTALSQPYSQYLVEDITGSGVDNLVLITTSESETIQMEMFTLSDGGFTSTIIPSFHEEPFTAYLNIAAGKSSAWRQFLVVDGYVGEGQTTIASEVLWYNTQTNEFEQISLAGTKDIYTDSKRYSADLISFDIDEDGAVEIPVQFSGQENGVLNYVQNSLVTLVSWRDFTLVNSQKSFGLFDDEYNYYLALPDELAGNLMIVDGEDANTIEVRNLAGDVLYFTLRVVDFDQSNSGWYQIGTVASKQIQVKLGEQTSSFLGVTTLSRSVYLL